MKLVRIALVSACAVVMLAGCLLGREPNSSEDERGLASTLKVETSKLEEEAKKTNADFNVWFVGHNKHYIGGEKVEFEFYAPRAGYLTVFYFDAENCAYMVVPNKHSLNNPKCKAGELIRLPPKNDVYDLVVVPPYGKEKIMVLVTNTPYGELPKVYSEGYRLIPNAEYERILAETRRKLQEAPSTGERTITAAGNDEEVRGLDSRARVGQNQRPESPKIEMSDNVPPVMIGVLEMETHDPQSSR